MSDNQGRMLRHSNGSPTRLSEAVYDGMVEQIAQGEFALNSRLPSELTLCAMFDASRPIVREALARLRDDGVIVSRQGSGSYVRRQPDRAVLNTLLPVGSVGDVQRCFEFRAGLEPTAAALAALRWQPDDMDAINACMEALDQCVRTGALGTDEDTRLHEAIADATHNHYHAHVQRLLRPHIATGMNITRSLSLLRTVERTQRVQEEHAAIIFAISKRDADLAAENMRKHITSARERMFDGV